MAIRPQRGVAIRSLAPAALMPAGAFAVHQLRYWLVYGRHTSAELASQGHSYLHSLVPWIVALIALGLGGFLLALGRALGGRCSVPRYTLSFTALWLLCAGTLVAVYTCQEFLEGLLTTGHPAGLAGIFGYGGWWSVPAALAVGLVLAAAFHGARLVLHEIVARRAGQPSAGSRDRIIEPAPRRILVPAPAPLAAGWSGRGPPA